MGNSAGWRGPGRLTASVILVVLVLGALAGGSSQARAEEAPAVTAATGDKPSFFIQVFSNLFNSRELAKTLGQPEFALWAFLALNVIVFTETGLFFGFFLPGDSLLVIAGVVCATSGWSLPLLLVTLSLSAIVGDSVGYMIGWHTGPKIFCREQSFFFRKDHLLKAEQFYEKHGGKTVILARFMPIIRTFAPVVAGVGKMNYRHFLFFNIFGGIGWVLSMVLFGYYLEAIIDPALKPIFGETFEIRDHLEKVVILVVLVSISPGIVLWLRAKLKGKTSPEPRLVEVE